jgi:hypothetical protein
MLARYPDLLPQPIPSDGHSKIMCESGERTFAELLSKSETDLAESTEAAVCLCGLDAEQRRQLAALMLDIVSELETRPAVDHTARWASQLRKEAKRRITVLNRKVEKARRAIEELRNYALDSDTADVSDNALHTAKTMLGFPYLNATGKALSALKPEFFPTVHEQVDLVKDYTKLEGVETFGMVRLYWFFRHGCNITGDDAEVRTARLRNAFWTKFGCEAIQFRPDYDGAESQGCDAVHVAVIRFRP